MQNELDLEYPELNIQLLGVNSSEFNFGNGGMTAGKDIPWLQDVDADGLPGSDAWIDWGVTFRDVIILDRENRQVGVFNLSTHNLSLEKDYKALRQMLVGADTVPEPTAFAILFIALAASAAARQ